MIWFCLFSKAVSVNTHTHTPWCKWAAQQNSTDKQRDKDMIFSRRLIAWKREGVDVLCDVIVSTLFARKQNRLHSLLTSSSTLSTHPHFSWQLQWPHLNSSSLSSGPKHKRKVNMSDKGKQSLGFRMAKLHRKVIRDSLHGITKPVRLWFIVSVLIWRAWTRFWKRAVDGSRLTKSILMELCVLLNLTQFSLFYGFCSL
jgi:hypothetical protein